MKKIGRKIERATKPAQSPKVEGGDAASSPLVDFLILAGGVILGFFLKARTK